jgi:hypothetical protein
MNNDVAAQPATITIEQLVANARRVRKESQHVAMAAAVVLRGRDIRSLCCWCAETHPDARVFRLPRGGECDACPYVGHDCLVVVVDETV